MFLLLRTGGFGGVKVSNQTKGKTPTGTLPANSGDEKHNTDVPSRSERQAARAAVIEPLFFSALFCCVEIFVACLKPVPKTMGIVPFALQVISNSIDTFIGYFAATLISMVLFLILQQYYYKCFAGLDHDSVIFPLSIVFAIYFVLFVLYLSVEHLLLKWLTLIFTVVACITVWNSLRKDVQTIEKGPEIHCHSAGVFVNENSTSRKLKQ